MSAGLSGAPTGEALHVVPLLPTTNIQRSRPTSPERLVWECLEVGFPALAKKIQLTTTFSASL